MLNFCLLPYRRLRWLILPNTLLFQGNDIPLHKNYIEIATGNQRFSECLGFKEISR